MSSTSTKDPLNYKRMARARPSKMDAQIAMEAFLADVAKLRQRHRIGEVVCIAGAYAVDGDREFLFTASQTLGSEIRCTTITAGYLQQAIQDFVSLIEQAAEIVQSRNQVEAVKEVVQKMAESSGAAPAPAQPPAGSSVQSDSTK